MESDWKRLPTGILQEWPQGISVTIEALAALMISISDNTATDEVAFYTAYQGILSSLQ